MIYQIKLTQSDYRRCVNWKEGKTDNVFFFPKGRKKNKAYLLCHGTKEGLVQVNGSLITIKKLLTILINYGLTQDEIEVIETISCYGGNQEEVTIDGITIRSMHNKKEDIEMNVKCTLDNRRYLEITI